MSECERLRRTELHRKVMSGVNYLNANGPEGWMDRIDTSRLDMASVTYCVLGQLYGNYDDGCWELDVSYQAEYALGFFCYPGDWNLLRELWVSELSERGTAAS